MKKIFYAALPLMFFLPVPVLAEKDEFSRMREKMINEQIIARGISDERTLAAMRKVPRHLFVPPAIARSAYEDRPLPIGHGQTISQPFIVAYMTEKSLAGPDDKVLEIGTGSGYQAAVLAELAKKVYSIEIVLELARSAEETLTKLGYDNVAVKWGDGYKGWPEHAPFDVIVITAAPPEIPETLIDQLKIGGRMVVPVGTHFQELLLIRRTSDGIETESLIPVRFVPMVPEAQNQLLRAEN